VVGRVVGGVVPGADRMTRPGLARRMRWLIATFVAILGLVVTLEWSTGRLVAVSTRNIGVKKPTIWVALNGVEYRTTREVSQPDRDSGRIHRAIVEARDPSSGDLLWKVTIREDASPGIVRGMPEPPGVDLDLARYALKLSASGKDIAARTPDGGIYLLDPETRRVRQLKAPSPPKLPILDARLPGKTRCEVHNRELVEDLVPIRYGFLIPEFVDQEVRRTRFPHAISYYSGGCVVGAAREARVMNCPACRDAEREWSKEPHVEPAGDEGGARGVD
jgi:hypothetical protein